jgi:hypothetical protein
MKSIDKINKKIAYYSETKPDNMTRQDYNKFMAELFAEKRELLRGEKTLNISKTKNEYN